MKLYLTNFDQEKGEILIPDVFSKFLNADARFEFVTRFDAKKLVLER